MNLPKVNQKDVLAYRKTLEKIAERGHYFLNPDKAFTFNNLENDLSDYYKAVSDMTRGKPLTDDIGNLLHHPSCFQHLSIMK